MALNNEEVRVFVHIFNVYSMSKLNTFYSKITNIYKSEFLHQDAFYCRVQVVDARIFSYTYQKTNVE